MSTAVRTSGDPEAAVRERYSAAARERKSALCCPVEYDARYLDAIPKEVRARDYGCGDPSRYVREGDTVLDLGSGSGKICFIAAQITGPRGRVIGVDDNLEMLALARRAAPVVAGRIGYDNVELRRGRIQDLALDPARLEEWLRKNPVQTADDVAALELEADRLRREEPLVADDSVDIAVSNCVLNLVRDSDKPRLFRELYRVLRTGGRIAISDIVSDEPVPERLKADPELWSGCISGALEERDFLRRLEQAGFYGIEVERFEQAPFAVVEGIELRSVTVTARKGKEGPCWEGNQAVIYRGPWRRVEDDDGHVLERGERAAVCAKTFRILTSEPYAGQVIPIEPLAPVPEKERKPFDCARTAPRHPRETKGEGRPDRIPEDACSGGSCC